jgi:hypothetical protein
MCDLHPREDNMIALSDTVWCDPCIVRLVSALNDGGLPTIASCCGHNRRPATTFLANDAGVVLWMATAEYDRIAGLWPGINDEPATLTLRGAPCDSCYSLPEHLQRHGVLPVGAPLQPGEIRGAT